jgi:hypothetical protein
MCSRREDLERLYGFLHVLREQGGTRRLESCHARMGWPTRGVYFFFEPGEERERDREPRVVRVGTHALRRSDSTLWKRLSQHKGTVGGSLPGGGNHRGSIFRRHVGAALLASGEWPDEIRRTWGVGATAPAPVRRVEYPLERAVSRYIGSMPFLWIEVNDRPSPDSHRGVIESGAISLLSNYGRPEIDPPSPAWLGRSSDRAAIRRSGLWNVNHVTEHATGRFLDLLDTYITSTTTRL